MSSQKENEHGTEGSTSGNSTSETNKTEAELDAEAAYFGSYSKLLIHEQMLRDKVRTETYMNAICSEENKALFFGKTVLDVGVFNFSNR